VRAASALALAALCVGASPAAAAGRREATLPWPLVFVQQPPQAAGARGAWAFDARPVPGARLVRLDPDGRLTVLSEGFEHAAGPDVSFDGRRLLFSGRQHSTGPRGVWELPLAGGAPARVTDGVGDCGEPTYMSENALNVPDFDQRVGWVAYTSDQPASVDLRLGGAPARHLYARSLSPVPERGFVTWRTTFNPGSDLSPTMLRDGRLLYASWIHSGRGAEHGPGRFFLMAMNWAGTGLNAVYGAHQGPALKHMATELSDRSLVFIESPGDRADGAGRIAEISWRRPLKSHRVLSRDGARYRDPRGLPDGRLLVSRQGREGGFGLYLFDRAAGLPGALVWDDPAWDDVDAHPVAPRTEPMGRSATVRTGRFSTGDIHCIDVYDSDREELQGLARGSVGSIRVLQAVPRPPAGGGAAPAALPDYDPNAPFGASADLRTRILGEVPVMADGSFHIRVPAGVPLTFQALDRDGVAVRTMRSWIWMREWNRRSCVGCHEDKEHAPPNRATQAMRSLMRPEVGEAGTRRSTDFVHDVMPIVKSRCYGACHGPEANRMDGERLVLDAWKLGPTNRAYRALVPEHVVPGKARRSPLMWHLRGGEDRLAHAALLDAELRTIAAWIDLGAQWDATDHDVAVPLADGAGGADCCQPVDGAGRGTAEGKR